MMSTAVIDCQSFCQRNVSLINARLHTPHRRIEWPSAWTVRYSRRQNLFYLTWTSSPDHEQERLLRQHIPRIWLHHAQSIGGHRVIIWADRNRKQATLMYLDANQKYTYLGPIGKVDPTARRFIFLGCKDTWGTYRFYVIYAKRVVVTAFERFHEAQLAYNGFPEHTVNPFMELLRRDVSLGEEVSERNSVQPQEARVAALGDS